MKKLLAVLLMSITLLGCSSSMLQDLMQAPQVKSVALKSFSAKDKTVIFDVALYNPNSFMLPISGLSGDMMLNQLKIGSLEAESDQNLAALSTQTVTVPIALDTNALIEAAQSVFTQRQANYNFNGGVKTPVGKIPFSKSGELSVTEIISTLLR
jgi:LEA14-like dessication related protein